MLLIFSIPAVQTKAADFALNKLKPILKTEMSIGKLKINFLNKLEIDDIYLEDQKKDTLLFAENLTVKFKLLGLLNRELIIESLDLKNFRANINKDNPEAPFNFDFIPLAFKTDSVKKEPAANPFYVYIYDVRLKNGNLNYDIFSEPETPDTFNANHIDVQNFNLRAALPSIDIKNLKVEIRMLKLWESSGILVDNLQGRFRSKNNDIWSDGLTVKVNESEVKISDAKYNTQTKAFELKAKSAQVVPADISIFSPQFNHLTKNLDFEADLNGQLPSIDVNKLIVHYGSQTRVNMNGYISDYSNYNESDLNVDLKEVRTTQADLENLIQIGSPTYKSPPQLIALGNLSLQMKANGTLGRFNYSGSAGTSQGNVVLRGIGRMTNNFEYLSFEGPVRADNIKLAQIIGESSGLDDASMFANTKVEIRKNLPPSVTAEGSISQVTYKDFQYTNLNFSGAYQGTGISGTVSTDTEFNKLNLTADFNFGTQKEINLVGNIDRLYLKPLIMRENWENPYLSAHIEGHLSGSDIDNLSGTLLIDSTSLYDNNFIYNPGPIYLQALNADSISEKKIQIMASLFEINVTGDYHISTIGKELTTILNKHLPSLIKLPEMSGQELINQNKFTVDLLLRNTEDFSYAFSLPFYNVEPANVHVNVDMATENPMQLEAYLPRLMFGNNDIRESKISLASNIDSGVDVNVNTYLVQDNGYINANIESVAALDSVMNTIYMNIENNVAKVNGTFQISMGFLRELNDEMLTNIFIHPTDFYFNKRPITVHPAEIIYTKDFIGINEFSMSQEGMLLLGIDGIASKNPSDSLNLFFNNTELTSILSALNINNINGLVNGSIVVNQALAEPVLHTRDFRIDNIQIYQDTIGTLRINGDLNSGEKGLKLNAFLENKGVKHLDIQGVVPTDPKDMIDLSVDLSDLPLAWVQPFAETVFSKLSGTINSNLNISGKLSEPITEGWLGVNKGIMQVAYSNVTYSISDTIQVNRDNIGFNDLVVRDDNGNTALITLELAHTNFGNINYELGLTLNDFLLLNNADRTDLIAYGNLKLSGDVNLTGGPAGIYGDVNLRNDSRSELKIEIPQTSTAAQYQGVIYINTPSTDSLAFLRKNPEAFRQLNTQISSGMPINIRGDIKLDPRLNIGVLINPTTGDAIEISGNGNLNVMYNSKADPSIRIYGDYVAEDGKVHYNLQSLKAINFELREGSTLTFVGDPLNTQFNITAYNQVTTDLVSLSESFKSSTMPSTRVPVNAVLEIQGDLEKMNLNYGIELPEATDEVEQQVLNYISTDESRIRQFAYLVTTGRFMAAEGSPDLAPSSNNMFTSFAAGALTKGLDALFSSALNDNWSISTNMETQNGSFDNVRMGVDLSTRLLDDRLRISTNLSYGERGTLASQQTFVGEFDLEYDINNWLMLRAYNRANERYYRQAPFTQGVGIVVTKEGRTLRDLFRFTFRRREN